MDFASALANLEKSAQEASRSSGNAGSSNNNNRNQGDDSRRRQRSPELSYNDRRQRPRRPYYDSHASPQQQQSHQQPYNNPLSGLVRFGYRVAPYRPLPPPPPPPPQPSEHGNTAPPPRPKHIAVLVMTIDDLPYEHIWKAWCNSSSSSSSSSTQSSCSYYYVSLLCHAKYPQAVTSTWLQRRLLVEPAMIGRGNHSWADPVFHTHQPEWGSVQITMAMMDLVRTALTIGTTTTTARRSNAAATGIPDLEEDIRFSSKRFLVNPDDDHGDGTSLPSFVPPVDKMIFISETCIPVTSLEDCMDALFGDEQMQQQQYGTTTVTVEQTAGSNSNNHATAAAEQQAAETPQPQDEPTANAGNDNDSNSKLKSPGSSEAANVPEESTRTTRFNPFETSWINARNRNSPGTPRNMYERDQFSRIHRMIPNFCRWKADQWMMLSRPHAAAIAAMDQHFCSMSRSHHHHKNNNQLLLWNCFAKINASDEMYFPTCLAILQILTEDQDKSKDQQQQQQQPPLVIKRPVTYTDWSEGMRNPATYRRGVIDFRKIAKLARAKGCLFARKFVPSLDIPGQETVVTGQISVEEWKTVMKVLSSESE